MPYADPEHGRAMTRERNRSQYATYQLDTCPDCGGAKRTKAARCRDCWRKQPRPRISTRPQTGRQVARENFPLAAVCQRCDAAPAVDRHHIDGDPCNNVASNIASLCRRCHMRVDGRLGSDAA